MWEKEFVASFETLDGAKGLKKITVNRSEISGSYGCEYVMKFSLFSRVLQLRLTLGFC